MGDWANFPQQRTSIRMHMPATMLGYILAGIATSRAETCPTRPRVRWDVTCEQTRSGVILATPTPGPGASNLIGVLGLVYERVIFNFSYIILEAICVKGS